MGPRSCTDWADHSPAEHPLVVCVSSTHHHCDDCDDQVLQSTFLEAFNSSLRSGNSLCLIETSQELALKLSCCSPFALDP